MDIEDGWIHQRIARDLPGLRLRYTLVDCGPDHVATDLRAALADRSNRFHGRHFFALRKDPIVVAYRTLYRHVGIDPDSQPTPVEELSREPIMRGGFLSHTRVRDALALTMLDTRIPLLAWDADRIDGPLGLRLDEPDDQLVIADAQQAIAPLFGPSAEGFPVTRRTRRAVIVAVGAPGVPLRLLDDALWRATEMLPTLQ